MRLNPKVHIEDRVFQKIMFWCNKADKYEVSGLGNVVFDEKNNTFIVNEVYLLEQENTGSTTDLNESAIGRLMHEHYKSGIVGDLNFWWHSHADMNVFWSGTDMATIEELGKNGWFLSTVFNKKEEMRSAYHSTEGVGVFVDNLDTTIIQSFSDKQMEHALASIGLQVRPGKMSELRWMVEPFLADRDEIAWAEEYDAKVKIKTFTSSIAGNRLWPISTGPSKSDVVRDYPRLHPMNELDDDGFDYYGYNMAMSEEPDDKSGVPDFEPPKRFQLSEEELEELFEEIEEFIMATPGCNREDVINNFESDYPAIAEIIHPNFRGLAND